MARNFALLSWAGTNTTTTITITCQTNVPCHLWLRWSLVKNQVHMQVQQSGKYVGRTTPYFCFVAWDGIEQNEAGDTILHTFTIPITPIYQCIYFGFVGSIGGLPSPSSTAIFKYCPLPPPGWPYLGTMCPRIWPVLRETDKLYTAWQNYPGGTGGVWYTPDYAVTWTRLQPAGLPAGEVLNQAIPMPAGWLFVTGPRPPAANVYNLYKAATFNGAWTLVNYQYCSGNSGSNTFALRPRSESSNQYWWHGLAHPDANYRTLWYASTNTLIPTSVVSYASTHLPGQLCIQLSPAWALYPDLYQPNAQNPSQHTTDPFPQATWTFFTTHSACYNAAVSGTKGYSTRAADLLLFTRSSTTVTSKALPADLITAAGAGTTAAIAASLETANLLLAIGNNTIGSIMRSTDAGTSWVTVKAAVNTFPLSYGASIGFFNLQPTWAWALTTTGCWISKDRGITWLASSQNLGI